MQTTHNGVRNSILTQSCHPGGKTARMRRGRHNNNLPELTEEERAELLVRMFYPSHFKYVDGD